MKSKITGRFVKITAFILAFILAAGLLPLYAARAAEANEIVFWTEEEFTGASVTVNLDEVKDGDALPAFSSAYKNWEIRVDGSMDLAWATRPGDKWSQDMIDSLKELAGKGYSLNGLPARFNITESNNSWPAANVNEVANQAGKLSKYIMYFIFDSERTNTDFDILEVDIRSIRAGDPLPVPGAEKDIWRFRTAQGTSIAKSLDSKWSQDLIDIVKKAAEEGNSVAAVDIEETDEFGDVTDRSKGYYKAVYWAVENGIVNGFKNGNFGPEDNCTRAQFAVMLWRLNGKPDADEDAKDFSDVNSSMSTYKSIKWASGEGIVNGFNDGTFGPDGLLTRRQIVIILWRLFGKQEPESGADFSDVKSSESSYKAISWALENGLIKGFNDGTFKPDDNCTRGQIVIILYRIVNKGFLAAV